MKTHVPELTDLTSSDFPGEAVFAQLEDGSYVYMQNAFYREEEDYYVIYSEHCGYHSLLKASVEEIRAVPSMGDIINSLKIPG